MEVSGKRTDTVEEEIPEDLEKLCELCEVDHVKTTANGICSECEEFMCTTCFRHHLKAKSCRHHVLIDTSESLTAMQRGAENVEKCKRHANEAIKYYCRKHKTVGCGDCMIPGHNACKPESIKDLSKEFEQNEDFKSILAKIEDIASANSASDKKIQESKKKNKRMLEEALKAIQNFRSEVNQYLDKAEGNIIKEVKEIELNNDKLLVKLDHDCELLSSEILEVRQKLDTELQTEIALFIQSVECKPKIMDIERKSSKIQTENEIIAFEFIPDEQLQGIITSIEKLGQVTSTKLETTEVTERGKQAEYTMEKAEKGQGPAADNIVIGARVRATRKLRRRRGQLGTVAVIHPDNSANVQWDTGGSWICIVGEGGDVELI